MGCLRHPLLVAHNADVDRFQAKYSFLTHAHSDHTSGLKAGAYASELTAALLPGKGLIPLRLDEKCHLPGFCVQLFATHHCPGSVGYVFIFPGPVKVGYTGDFRFIEVTPLLKELDTLYYDDTLAAYDVQFPDYRTVRQELRSHLLEREDPWVNMSTLGLEMILLSLRNEFQYCLSPGLQKHARGQQVAYLLCQGGAGRGKWVTLGHRATDGHRNWILASMTRFVCGVPGTVPFCTHATQREIMDFLDRARPRKAVGCNVGLTLDCAAWQKKRTILS